MSTPQQQIQAFIDRLTPVERHRVCRVLNECYSDYLGLVEYSLDDLELVREVVNAPRITIVPGYVPMVIQYDSKGRELYRIFL